MHYKSGTDLYPQQLLSGRFLLRLHALAQLGADLWRGEKEVVTVFPTALTERASCAAHKLLCTGEVPTTLVSFVLVVAVSLSQFCRLKHFRQANHRYPIPPPHHQSLIDRMMSLRTSSPTFIHSKVNNSIKVYFLYSCFWSQQLLPQH